jgi:predicted nucleic acid-binding protein
MVTKVIIDANVLIDLLLQRCRYQAAKDLYDQIERGEVEAFISPSIVHIVAYWAKKNLGPEKTKSFLIQMCDKVEVVSVDHRITMKALLSHITDVEDAIQYYAAVAHDMRIFISNDQQLRKVATSVLPVLNPDEFLRILKLH